MKLLFFREKSEEFGKTWEEFEMERGVCNLASMYSPEFIKMQVLKSPYDYIKVVVNHK